MVKFLKETKLPCGGEFAAESSALRSPHMRSQISLNLSREKCLEVLEKAKELAKRWHMPSGINSEAEKILRNFKFVSLDGLKELLEYLADNLEWGGSYYQPIGGAISVASLKISDQALQSFSLSSSTRSSCKSPWV